MKCWRVHHQPSGREKNHSQLKHRKAKCARVHIFICLRVTGPERALKGHQSSLLSIPQNREALKAMCFPLRLHTPPVLGNRTQKDVTFLQRGTTHPLLLSDQSSTIAFGLILEIQRRVIKKAKFMQSAINYPSHGHVFKFTIISEEEQIKSAKLDGARSRSSSTLCAFFHILLFCVQFKRVCLS